MCDVCVCVCVLLCVLIIYPTLEKWKYIKIKKNKCIKCIPSFNNLISIDRPVLNKYFFCWCVDRRDNRTQTSQQQPDSLYHFLNFSLYCCAAEIVKGQSSSTDIVCVFSQAHKLLVWQRWYTHTCTEMYLDCDELDMSSRKPTQLILMTKFIQK